MFDNYNFVIELNISSSYWHVEQVFWMFIIEGSQIKHTHTHKHSHTHVHTHTHPHKHTRAYKKLLFFLANIRTTLINDCQKVNLQVSLILN